MGKASKTKGARGEREFASFCRDQGYFSAYRGQQYNGANGNADVEGLPGIHVEVKRVEALRLYDALDQSRRDARPGEIPIVAHRKNNCRWVVIMDAEDWMNLYREWDAGRLPFVEKIPEEVLADFGREDTNAEAF
jgi:hypothetical protein